MKSDTWPMVHAERAALIEDLEHLDDAQWEQPSLCDGWTVHDVVAHMVDVARTTPISFVVDIVRARFDFDRQNARGVEEVLHGEDIRRPLGLTRAYPQDAVVRALRHQARTSKSFGGAKELVAGVRLTATGTDLAIGDGPEVRGTALALLLVISGRRVALDELDGPGVDSLAANA